MYPMGYDVSSMGLPAVAIQSPIKPLAQPPVSILTTSITVHHYGCTVSTGRFLPQCKIVHNCVTIPTNPILTIWNITRATDGVKQYMNLGLAQRTRLRPIGDFWTLIKIQARPPHHRQQTNKLINFEAIDTSLRDTLDACASVDSDGRLQQSMPNCRQHNSTARRHRTTGL